MSISITDVPARSGVESITGRPWLAVLTRLVKHQIVRRRERRRMHRDACVRLAWDDRMLADIGSHRCDVENAVRSGLARDDR